jgi:hypothetical protein
MRRTRGTDAHVPHAALCGNRVDRKGGTGSRCEARYAQLAAAAPGPTAPRSSSQPTRMMLPTPPSPGLAKRHRQGWYCCHWVSRPQPQAASQDERDG